LRAVQPTRVKCGADFQAGLAPFDMLNAEPDEDLLFEVVTPLGFTVRTSKGHWAIVTMIKHPVMTGRELIVQDVLKNPEEIRLSSSDESVYLFYKLERERRWVCAVAKRLNGDGFLITAYPTDAIKEGKRVWPE
jgi:hypothetical protein